MRILSLSPQYPNAVQPGEGMAIEGRLRALAATGVAHLRVVAPRPWRLRGVPDQELRRGLLVHHPALPPGAQAMPRLLAGALWPVLRDLRGDFPFDLLDAYGLYPAGAAVAWLARRFDVPFTVTVHGGEPPWRWGAPLARRQMRRTIQRAAGLVAVAPPVMTALTALGASPERLRLLPDGVDLTLFRPGDRTAARLRLGFRGRTLLAVGPFPQRRDESAMIEALALLPEVDQLVLVGGGPGGAVLADLSHQFGVARRIRMLGPLPQEALPEIYRAADLLVVTGARETGPACVLEALACGTPVVATLASSAAALVTTPDAGRLVERATPEALAAAIATVLATPPDRSATRAFAERFDWSDSAVGQIALFAGIIGQRPTPLAA